MPETRARLEAAFGPAKPDSPPVHPGPLVLLRLTRTGPMTDGISVAKRLRVAGITLREAHAIVGELREVGTAPVRVAEGAGLEVVRNDLRAFGVSAAWAGCDAP